MIAVTYDVYGERIRAEVYVDETEDHVVIDIRHHWGTASRLHRADAVSLLRAMLREISGPSIDDVREVWGDPRMVTRWCGAGIGHKCSWSVRAGGTVPWVPSDTFGDTEREALQAAYDAGVERRKGDGA